MVYIIIKGGNSVVYLVILYSSSIYYSKKISTVHRTGPKYFDKKNNHPALDLNLNGFRDI